MSEPTTPSAPAPAPTAARPEPGHSPGRARDILTELLIVTLGVLIALSVDSFRQLREHRSLVEEARRNIAQEIRDNTGRLDRLLGEIDKRQAQVDQVVAFADDLLAKRPIEGHTIELGYTVEEISDAAWQSAGHTGAFGFMEYEEVQRFSRLYDLQALLSNYQRRSVDQVAEALSMLQSDPDKTPARDVQTFRDRVLSIRGSLVVIDQVGHGLKARYGEVLPTLK
ncbi:MAG TPA: hypothetical protein VFV78_13575 [Vicinamibacterales bacterium]|nr:hypothetical protein [Vicinamibacterales bacterium]